jgi:DNA-binding CsgD family transcriptional regulator
MSVRQWHAYKLYVELYKPNGNEHLLNLRIPDGPGRTIRLLCWRGPGKGFTERDKTDLFLLKPHIEMAYRRGQRMRAVSALTTRQRQLLQLVAQGYTNYQIARRLGVAEGTIRAHLYQIYSRLGVSSHRRRHSVTLRFPRFPGGSRSWSDWPRKELDCDQTEQVQPGVQGSCDRFVSVLAGPHAG